ncbi:MAG: hypothetical protein WBF89_16045, partial [Steroidobacteraceae bacterium]
MTGMSLRQNALILALLTAIIAVLGDWGGDLLLSGLWRLPAAALLLGLAYEYWVVSRCGLSAAMEPPDRLLLGRGCPVRFTFRHELRRSLDIELAPSAPDSFEVDAGTMRLRIPAGAPAVAEWSGCPSRLGLYSWPAPRARAAGPLRLAWWPNTLTGGREVRVLPDLFR